MKTLLRIINRIEGNTVYWHDDYAREKLRRELNDEGFYVLTGKDDTLEVYVIRDNTIMEDLW